MNYLERLQLIYVYARRSEGILQSLAQSFGSETTAQVALKSGRDETARMMIYIAEHPDFSLKENTPDIFAQLGRACFGNGELACHYLDELKAFAENCNHTSHQVMQEVASLYNVRVPHLGETCLSDHFWGNPREWDACVLQNPEIAAVSPYASHSSYSAAQSESKDNLHDYLQQQLQAHRFENLDVCRLLIEDKTFTLTQENYEDMVKSQPKIGSFLPHEVIANANFRDTLMEADPILALRTIPKVEQSDALRLKAISQNAEAYRWIDDDDFKRRHFVIQEMVPMRLDNQPTLEQCQHLQDKASALLEAIESGNIEKRTAVAAQNWMAQGSEVEQEIPTVRKSEPVSEWVPSDFSETAKYHFNEQVRADDVQEQFCFFDDADGSLDYNRDTQKFTFTSRDGRKHDMTDSMDTLRDHGRPFHSLTREEQSKFLGMENFTTNDSQGRATDFIAQRAADGTTSFIGKLSSKAAGNVAAIAVQKTKKLWDDAMAAVQL